MEVIIYIAGLDEAGERVAALVDAGFDDALITQDRTGGTGAIELEVDEFTPQLVSQWFEWVTAAGVLVRGFGPPQLVSAAEIADRIGRTRQSVGQLIRGERGPGGFPAPINVGARSEQFVWADVVSWLTDVAHVDVDVTEHPVVDEVVELNAALRASASVAKYNQAVRAYNQAVRTRNAQAVQRLRQAARRRNVRA